MLWTTKVTLQTGQMTDLTDLVAEQVKLLDGEGICTVTALSTTAGLFLCSDERRKDTDLIDDAERAFPSRKSYTAQGDPEMTAAQVKSAVYGASRSVPVADGKLMLGENQRIKIVDFAGADAVEIAVCVIA